jgi:hypothetical protein
LDDVCDRRDGKEKEKRRVKERCRKRKGMKEILLDRKNEGKKMSAIER